MFVFEIRDAVVLVGILATLGVKAFAFVSALLYRPEAYEAAGKLTKVGWSLILGIGLVAHLLMPSLFGLINLVFLVAAFVYLADVRPALKELTRR